MYYVSLDSEIHQHLSLPDPYQREHARYFVDEVAIGSARNGQGADFVIEDAETEIAPAGWACTARTAMRSGAGFGGDPLQQTFVKDTMLYFLIWTYLIRHGR